MASVASEEPVEGRSVDEVPNGQQLCPSGEALVEWRSSEQIENGTPSTSPPYWDSDDDDGGPKPSELYGKYTWKIDKFSQITKRELRSNAFEVGGYKWYILIYPQGCDVCNHLSLFLCVANHDKLLPGWSHFAQFTIAVVNKDPKKSKYSDTLHRFLKKEHDWGWKKFMELSKVMDGFIDADTLIIKAQVQVIRERADRPFRCLDCQYRRELVRVYLTNVEQICRRFVEEHRGKLEKLIEDKSRWTSFRAFWLGMDQSSRRRMSREKTDSILKVLVKHFFIEKEVTSTLVMDSLYSGLKALEGQTKGKKSKGNVSGTEELAVHVICIEKETLMLVDDVLLLVERAAMEPLPPKDDKGPQNRTKDGTAGEEFNKDSIERDERRLTELGRRTIQIFILAHIFSKIEVAYQEAVSLKRQEELIREEEAAWLADVEQKMKRGTGDKEKSKKKQGKQKRNNRKGKDKGRDEKPDVNVLDKTDQDITNIARKGLLNNGSEVILEKGDAVEDVSDLSDSADGVPESLPPDSEDRDLSPVNCIVDISEVHPPRVPSSSIITGLSSVQNGTEVTSLSIVDDSSSTCSIDSVPSVMTSLPRNGRNAQRKVTSEASVCVNEELGQLTETATDINGASQNFKTMESSSRAAVDALQDSAILTERHTAKEEVHGNPCVKNMRDMKVSGDRTASVMSPPQSPSRSTPSIAPLKLESKIKGASATIVGNKLSLDSPKQSDRSTGLSNSVEIAATLKRESQKFATPKLVENPSGHQVPVFSEKPPAQPVRVTAERLSMPQMPIVSRPLSAPILPAPRPAVSKVSVVQTAPMLARSVSLTGQLGPEATASSSQSYVPQSYRNAILGSHVPAKFPSYSQGHSASPVVNASHSYSQAPALVSAPFFLPHNSERMDSNSLRPSLPYGMPNHNDMLPNSSVWMETYQKDNRRNLISDRPSLLNDMQSYDSYNPMLNRSKDHSSSEPPASTSGRQSCGLVDEFPHIDIINDLLEDEQGIGMATQSNSGHSTFNCGPHNINRQFSLPGCPSMSGGSLSQTSGSSQPERTQNHLDTEFQRGYCSFSGSPYDSARDMIPQSGQQQHINGQIDGLIPNQWPMAGSDLPYLSIRNADNSSYPCHILDYSYNKVDVNGYTVFRPSNGL
ncbi:LOW QUALITY PROTEIN: TNF receptor-associated factor homolog 1b-like [Primulina tabacum]|uniref:LOW QUALITY PROTEIN: TNF receptor-associated factor homolog 1b-like n=1 Tax=Primulina tabacum TaxID=48773 RepID=UPI003F5927E0